MADSGVQAWLAELGIAASAALAQLVEEGIHQAREARPNVEVAIPDFLAHIARHLPESREDALASLPGCRFADLYLACACGRGDDAALRAFDREYMAKLPLYVARMNLSEAFVDDLRQVVQEKLFVAQNGEAPKIAGYSGRGALEGWLRIVAVNTALKLLRPGGAGAPIEIEREVLTTPPDPEVDYMKLRYRKDFEAALRSAFAALSARDRNILRLHFIDGLSIDAMGAVYGVHRATAARWLVSVREALLAEVRSLLRQQLRVTAGELESLEALVQSQLDISMRSLLKTQS